MLPGWLAVSVVLAYVGALYALAAFGDRIGHRVEPRYLRKIVYALAACVYCSSWTFYGAIGLASRHGGDFLPIYIGPIVVYACLFPLLVRMIRLAKAQNITSIADFVAVRYGKSAAVAATVTIIATLSLIPFLAVQIKAIALSISVFTDASIPLPGTRLDPLVSFLVTVTAGAMAMAIGANRLDATEHHRGLMLVVAASSVFKIVAFVIIGVFVTWGIHRGIGDLTQRVAAERRVAAIIDSPPSISMWLVLGTASIAATLLLPRQFHVSIVENRHERDTRTAAWVVPLYVCVICLLVMPIAAAGLLAFPSGAIDRDLTVLALPIRAGSPVVTLVALIGGVSAALASILVSTTTLSLMASNDIVMPLLLRLELRRSTRDAPRASPILTIRHVAIAIILVLAWLSAMALRAAPIYAVGLVSLGLLVQIAPAALGGLVWARGTALGAIGGSAAGILVWAYTVVLPAASAGTSPLVLEGPLGIEALKPTDLLGLNMAPFQQGLFWSLAINMVVYVALSLSRRATQNERIQADIFVRRASAALTSYSRARSFSITLGELLGAVSRYLGRERAATLFGDYLASRDMVLDEALEADAKLIKFTEHLIASAVGAASSRTIVSLLLDRHEAQQGPSQIIDDVALEVQNSRDVLQHAIDIARDGMAVFDRDLRLVVWNRAYRELFQLPPELMRIGIPLDVLVRSNAERGIYGAAPVDESVADRLETLTRPSDGDRMHQAPFGRVLEMRSVRLHNGGLFFTYTDATAQVKSEEELEAENVTLERRVRERTEELESLNYELARAKAEAEDANISKTRFLAAASHDILQPLNAARLYTTSLRERLRVDRSDGDVQRLATHVDASLEAVEDILGALLEISHLDAGATKTEVTTFDIGSLLHQLEIEFEPAARGRGLRLKIIPSSARVISDRRLLRRLLQNLISNAVKYTVEGRVLVGLRKVGGHAVVCVHDTGVGIPEASRARIFREFERLPNTTQGVPGAGLGLSIVERLSRVLDHEIGLRSEPGRGSTFSVRVPIDATAASTTTYAGFTRAMQPRQRSLEGLHVAAIDNEVDILVAMESLLAGWDCVAATGVDLADIVAALSRGGFVPDVIVADYHVGESNGLEIIASLRALYGPCPAVLVTADRAAEIRDAAFAVDVRVLNKPLKPAALRALLSQWRLVKAAAE